MKQRIKWISVGFFMQFVMITSAQSPDITLDDHKTYSFFVPADSFSQKRFHTALAFSTVTYSAFSVGLYHAWYKNFDKGSFQLFNDWGEWRHMDKWGHVYSSYFQSALCYNGARWTGLNRNKSIWTGVAISTLFQTTVEVMDGFSTKWGFSLPDVASNTAGSFLFAAQQYFWNEQRISLKLSSSVKNYPNEQIVSTDGLQTEFLRDRVYNLYGSGLLERYLKDYNAQVYWASIKVESFLPDTHRWPSWLNIALGYSAENMFGGFDNSWTQDGHIFVLNQQAFPRYSQFFIGLDIDLPSLNPRNPFLKTVCSVFNIFKIPGPAIELNTQGQIKFHLIKF